MASIRRTLSPVPRPGAEMNGDTCLVASPLSKSSSVNHNYSPSRGSLDYALSKARAFVFGFLSQRYLRPLERSISKGQLWRRALFHFLACFVLGAFVGLTPFASVVTSINAMPKQQAFTFDVLHPIENVQLSNMHSNETSVLQRSSALYSYTPEVSVTSVQKDKIAEDVSLGQSIDQLLIVEFRKLLIIVTPTHVSLSQAHNLQRLTQTLKLVPSPLLWIVVEMTSQSAETANILKRTSIMYRHLVCTGNLTEVEDKNVHMRNVALSHIEAHHLDGIIYFADEENFYSTGLFQQMRQIRRFGTWAVAKLKESQQEITIEGPVCNGSQVTGWHTGNLFRRYRRFDIEMSGFGFNSTILWDPERWHRPTPQPVRQLDTIKNEFQASSFIEQIVEDEGQMEGLPHNCSRVMVWQIQRNQLYSNLRQRYGRNHSNNRIPLSKQAR